MKHRLNEAFVGIDVAFAKKKRLPICICVNDHGRLTPLELRKLKDVLPPKGLGNKAALDGKIVEQYSVEAVEYIKRVEERCNIRVQRIAIDAPSAYKQEHIRRRSAEIVMDERGISCFATPSKSEFNEIIAKARRHLDNGGAENNIPHANQLWMLIGFALFQALGKEYECIEVFPQAIVRELGESKIHKSKPQGYLSQVEALSTKIGWGSSELSQKLMSIGYGSKHDKLDALLSAWVASLPPEDRIACGRLPDDVIWIPKV